MTLCFALGTVKDIRAHKQMGELVPVRHTCAAVDGRLVIVGGGAFCFSFGSVFGRAWTLSVKSLMKHVGTASCLDSWVFWSRRKKTKEVKDDLKAMGWLNSAVKSCLKGDMIGLPITAAGATILQEAHAAIKQELHLSSQIPISDCLITCLANGGSVEKVRSHKSQHNRKIAPSSAVGEVIKSVLLQSKSIIDEELASTLCLELPTKWEKLGDLVLIPEDSMTSEVWTTIGEPVWRALATGLGASRLARQSRVAPSGIKQGP